MKVVNKYEKADTLMSKRKMTHIGDIYHLANKKNSGDMKWEFQISAHFTSIF